MFRELLTEKKYHNFLLLDKGKCLEFSIYNHSNILSKTHVQDGIYCTFDEFGVEHSYRDIPAIIDSIGNRYWMNHGILHRDGDKPAIIYRNGAMKWFKYGEIFRENDKPSTINSDGTKRWVNSMNNLHREGNKPAIIYSNGNSEFWINGVMQKDNLNHKNKKNFKRSIRFFES